MAEKAENSEKSFCDRWYLEYRRVLSSRGEREAQILSWELPRQDQLLKSYLNDVPRVEICSDYRQGRPVEYAWIDSGKTSWRLEAGTRISEKAIEEIVPILRAAKKRYENAVEQYRQDLQSWQGTVRVEF
jgi:hypothetical protein